MTCDNCGKETKLCRCKEQDADILFQRATEAFNIITSASYLGFDFKCFLAQSPMALETAEKLAKILKNRR